MKILNILIASLLSITAGTTACAHPVNGNADTTSDTTISKTEERETPIKVSILGDSYSTFEGYIPEGNIAWYKTVPKEGRPTDVTKVEQTWWKIFLDQNGYELEKNNSYSGSTVCNTGYERKDYSDRSFVTRLEDIGDPDIILIFGGTNDDWANSPVGEYQWGDWTWEDLYSYRPAMAYMLHTLKEKHPDSEIVMIINDELSPAIVNSTETVCERYGVRYMLTEGISKMSGHPDSEGMKRIASELQEFMNK